MLAGFQGEWYGRKSEIQGELKAKEGLLGVTKGWAGGGISMLENKGWERKDFNETGDHEERKEGCCAIEER